MYDKNLAECIKGDVEVVCPMSVNYDRTKKRPILRITDAEYICDYKISVTFDDGCRCVADSTYSGISASYPTRAISDSTDSVAISKSRFFA